MHHVCMEENNLVRVTDFLSSGDQTEIRLPRQRDFCRGFRSVDYSRLSRLSFTAVQTIFRRMLSSVAITHIPYLVTEFSSGLRSVTQIEIFSGLPVTAAFSRKRRKRRNIQVRRCGAYRISPGKSGSGSSALENVSSRHVVYARCPALQ